MTAFGFRHAVISHPNVNSLDDMVEAINRVTDQNLLIIAKHYERGACERFIGPHLHIAFHDRSGTHGVYERIRHQRRLDPRFEFKSRRLVCVDHFMSYIHKDGRELVTERMGTIPYPRCSEHSGGLGGEQCDADGGLLTIRVERVGVGPIESILDSKGSGLSDSSASRIGSSLVICQTHQSPAYTINCTSPCCLEMGFLFYT
ncbi:hypothetical protein Tcan_17786 [Toxocara canis]|uniref:Uncharacterized protein n=1 Tax=Toxocara canis TaxID=6265 RepID=A0A0B2UU98_TOXCA|nr:hypothetical protein Tcan_17786 [Toxocara canis]